jgi:hypothetical protein
MSLNALKLVQEAAKRLNIMVPTTINTPEHPDTSTIDYDANMLVAAANAAIRQNASINLFNREVQMSPIYLKQPKYIGTGSPDIVIDMSTYYSDFESLLGDTITINKYDGSASRLVTNKYAFRELSTYDFAIKQQYTNYTYFTVAATTPVPDPDNPDFLKREMPSKKTGGSQPKNDFFEATGKRPLDFGITPPKHMIKKEGIDVETKGNGFRFIRHNFTKLLWICNDIIPETDLVSGNLMLVMLYYSTWIVSLTTSSGNPPVYTTDYKDAIDNDADLVNLPDELVILGTIISYKATNGLDYSLELGQQKALIDAIKVNQENVRYTHNTNIRQQTQVAVPQER